ncbi:MULTISPECIES: LutC/YkgG family protein [Burkholderia]|jgi:L-lactate dehydrogenase complex protein LldG|uniref:LutC/YkgG family protein n=1 Tax=Burkholderia TaxID=32008 RepID=UPI00050E3C96|nr:MULTISPECIES: lactate utilization protein C [Burkholderia]AYQ87677.1 lactate utilization protein C [Burkholderia gladioli]KGE10875.1 membrane protein [Burkholderia gladioli]NBI48521.1 lactate utilization protein C [Burkholderia sp. ISTR5]
MDTSAARRNIFARIRAAQGRPAEPDALEREQAADYLARHPAGPRPPMPDDAAGLLARFSEEAERMSTTVEAVDTLAEVPAAAARYLQARSLAARAIAWRTLADIDWASAGLEVDLRKPVEGDLVGITGCFCASAETGSLVLLSGPDTYASAALLPETHLVVVPASRIVAGHEDAFALIRAERGELPRAVNIVSGPSRTGDIEQTIILGAHGPYRVHAIIVRGA